MSDYTGPITEPSADDEFDRLFAERLFGIKTKRVVYCHRSDWDDSLDMVYPDETAARCSGFAWDDCAWAYAPEAADIPDDGDYGSGELIQDYFEPDLAKRLNELGWNIVITRLTFYKDGERVESISVGVSNGTTKIVKDGVPLKFVIKQMLDDGILGC